MYSVTRKNRNMTIHIINKDFFSTEAVIKVERRHDEGCNVVRSLERMMSPERPANAQSAGVFFF
jgi:hypothetical protein